MISGIPYMNSMYCIYISYSIYSIVHIYKYIYSCIHPLPEAPGPDPVAEDTQFSNPLGLLQCESV